MTDGDDPARERLALTLAEIERCLDDAAAIVSFGKERFDQDWIVRRAAKNVVAELAESVSRLPQSFTDRHPQVPWRAIAGMHNRVVHRYHETDFDVVWYVLASDLPGLRRIL